MKTTKLLFLFLSIIFLSTCNDNITQPIDGGGPGIIVPGISVEEVKLGDTKETVEAKLGKPTSGGLADGIYRSWRGIGKAYKGKTKEGIGIGTALEKVHQVYGLPEETFLSEGIITNKYCLNGKKLEIGYRDSLIIGMSTGYFVPLPQDNPCK